jgi:ATP-dependent Lon protease
MPKDSKVMTRSRNKKETKKEELSRMRKKHDTSSDSESEYSSEYNSDSYEEEQEDEEEEEELDIHEYRKFLAKTFPSNHINKKIKAGNKLKHVLKEEHFKNASSSSTDEDDDDDEEYIPKKSRTVTKSGKTNSKSKSKKELLSDSDEEEEVVSKKTKTKTNKTNKSKSKKIVSSESEYDEEEEEDEDSEVGKKKTDKPSKFNIIFTIGEKHEDSQEDASDAWDTYSDDYEDDDEETENEDDSMSSDAEEDDEEEEEEEVDEKISKKVRNKKETTNAKKSDKNTKENESIPQVPVTDDEIINKSESSNEKSEIDIITALKELQTKNKDNKLITECIKVCEDKIKISKKSQEKKAQKYKDRNNRIFKRILRDKNTNNDFDFFEKLEIDQQKKIIKELREINKITRIEKPYRLTLLESDIPTTLKSAAMKKISSLRYMEPGSGEYYKIKNWVDTFMRLPFGNYKTLPISIDDGVEACHDFMANAQKTLNEAVYGLNDAKMQIMQMLGQLITNPKAIGTAIAIHGPAGTGKTSIVKEGISKILNRPFAFIALGGATDSSFLEGHGYTYEGSTWGKIVQILLDSKCMNPVIYFDELDKISETPKGDEITGILTHLTDTSQNSQFHDKYFSEIDFDLSKCLFIFSYNDESKINPILRDRMYRIQTKGYNQKQKTVISNDYLLPRVREQVRFTTNDIIVPDDIIHYIIDNFCGKEDGVRNLKRCFEIIYTKLNLYRLMRPESNLFEEDMSLKVVFPFTVTKNIVDKLIKGTKENMSTLHSLYV